ncbi:MAG TPA: aldo/keto reductase [Polyangiaceae bacterium]|nr:aldo/keto reductase [Polyangiaceae bacterium]
MSESGFGPVVLGGNVFGWTVERDAAFRILDAFADFGGVAIDTADVYPAWVPGRQGGESEQMIGGWLAQRGRRGRFKISTKVAKWGLQPGLSPENIRTAVEGSLRRLQTDYIDVYYAHEDDQTVPQEDYLLAFDGLVRAGKVRELGASNFGAARLSSALTLSRANGLSTFQYSQDRWSLVEREIEQVLLPTLKREGLREFPYYSLASGFLTGKYRPFAQVESARAGSAAEYLKDPRNLTLLATLDELASTYDVPQAAIALAWLRAEPTVIAPIASARTLEQLRPFFQSTTFQLSAEDHSRLSSVTAR